MHLPFLLKPIKSSANELGAPFKDRTGFICIGNGKHAPNTDAIQWLYKEIWPKIRKALPKTVMNIYGAYLPQVIMQLHKPAKGFLVHGRVTNVNEVMGNARVSLAPLRFGAGIKGKLISAMQCGTPNVTTTIGAEGMHQQLPWNGSITDDVQHFANAAIALYQNESLWKTAQLNGVEIINACYSQTSLERDLEFKIAHLSSHLEAHRSQNYVGSLLHHHSMASTKYMAKWIAAKNNNR